MKKASTKPPKGVYLRGAVWWIRYRNGGAPIRRPIGRDRALAERALEEIRRQIDRGDYQARPKPERRTVSAMAAEYLELKAEKRSIRGDAQMLRDFEQLYGARHLDQITREDLERHLLVRKKAGAGNATRNRILACIRHMLNIAVQAGYIQANPATGIRRAPEASRRKYVLSEQELQAVVDAAAPHLRPILVLAVGTGLRKGDQLGLRWNQVDFEHNLIQLWTQKTGEPLEIPLVAWAREALLKLKASANGSSFVLTYQGDGIKDCRTAWEGALRRSGLADRGYRFHDLRRTAASMLHRAGATLVQVQKILGHKSVTTTERYLGVKWEETAQAINLLNTPGLAAIAEKVSTIRAQEPVTAPEPPIFSTN